MSFVLEAFSGPDLVRDLRKLKDRAALDVQGSEK